MSRPQPSPPTPAPQPTGGSHLRVVPVTRAKPGRIRRTGLIVVFALFAGLFVIGAVQAVVTEAQGRIDQLNGQISDATAADRELRLHRAELLSPAVLREVARDRLGMVTPTTVVYLVPSETPTP